MRLICFGDSWTAGHGVETDNIYKEEPFPNMFTQKLREQNSWPRYVANYLNCAYVNLGICGFGNDFIFREMETCIRDGLVVSDDLIIIMLSYPYRYQKYDEMSVVELFWKMEELLKNYKHFFFNSFFPTFQFEDYDIKKLPKSFINPENTTSEILKKYEIENDVSVWEYNSRSVWNDEKNYWEGDYHPNLTGYKLIAEYIYGEIERRM